MATPGSDELPLIRGMAHIGPRFFSNEQELIPTGSANLRTIFKV